MLKIATIVGSISKDSVNMKVAEFMKERYEDKVKLEIITLEEVPMYNRDNEKNTPKAIKEHREIINSSDGILFITPEYNYTIPGVLKNAIDWYSRVEYVLKERPIMIIGASPGNTGTIRAQLHLREIMIAPTINARVLQGNEVYISNVMDYINEDGKFEDEKTAKFLDDRMMEFKEFIKE